jgi:hypothetical protein
MEVHPFRWSSSAARPLLYLPAQFWPTLGRLSGRGLFLEGELELWENGAEFEARELGDGGQVVAPHIGGGA